MDGETSEMDVFDEELDKIDSTIGSPLGETIPSGIDFTSKSKTPVGVHSFNPGTPMDASYDPNVYALSTSG